MDIFCGNCDGDSHPYARVSDACCGDPDPLTFVNGIETSADYSRFACDCLACEDSRMPNADLYPCERKV